MPDNPKTTSEPVSKADELPRQTTNPLGLAAIGPVERAIEIAVRWGGIDGEHHKTWVIDQMVRALAGDGYTEIVREAKAGEDGPDTYEWDEGTAP